VTEDRPPAAVRVRVSFGPEAHAQAANLTSGNYIPAGRAARLIAQMAGVRVSVGWIAGSGRRPPPSSAPALSR
jgi:transposase